VLPGPLRMRSSNEFRQTVRLGVRTGRPSLVVHARTVVVRSPVHSQVGFVVSKAVGNAVIRNRVRRRLRHLTLAELVHTPPGTQVVVRALPAAATTLTLASDLSSAWTGALRKLTERSAGSTACGR